MKLNKKIVLLLIITGIFLLKTDYSQARLGESWDFKRLSAESDVIVIAIPVEQESLSEEIMLPNINPQVKAKGKFTTFITLAVLKGELENKSFKLHHYLLSSPPEIMGNGPILVDFDLEKKNACLMFLKKDANKNYIPASGATDPYYSIIKITDTQYSDEYINALKEEQKKEPVTKNRVYKMSFRYILEDVNKPELIILIDDFPFKSMGKVKDFILRLPPGSTLEFRRTCIRLPNTDPEPFDTEEQINDFKKFCEGHNINFVFRGGA